MKKRIAYLGPPGTFTEEALLKVYTTQDIELVPYQNISDILFAAHEKEVDEGIVPIENSIEGSVNVTLDVLIFQVDLFINKEIVVNVDHNLLAKKGTNLGNIQAVYSIPHATAQCRQFLKDNLNNVEYHATNSTAEAAKLVSNSDEQIAAISTKLAARLYGLDVLATDIQDVKENTTRFVIVDHQEPDSTGFDKTSIVCFIYENRPGSLLEILQEFAGRNINLTKIESRPTKKALGDYCFLIDIEGHIKDQQVGEALQSLAKKLRKIKILGSFPRWKNA
jgi:prephenate dehydratase